MGVIFKTLIKESNEKKIINGVSNWKRSLWLVVGLNLFKENSKNIIIVILDARKSIPKPNKFIVSKPNEKLNKYIVYALFNYELDFFLMK